jgi:glycosyltransferase involved in cell wall biosynthesis
MTDPLGQSQVIPYLTGLSKLGYDFTILSCEKSENYLLQKKEIKNLLRSFGIRWEPIAYHKKPPAFSTIYDVIQLYKKAKKLHSQSAFDMVHTRPGIPALVGLKMKTRFGIKFLNDIRELYADSRADGHIWNLENFFYKKIYRFFKQQESAAVTKSDGIVCLTYAAEKIIKSWPEYKLSIPLQVIPCSVDLNLFNPFHFDEEFKKRLRADLHIKENEFIVSYLGSVGSWYLIDEMIRFFKIISDHNKNAKFLFISPNAKAELLRLANKFKLDEKKIIVKKATRKEVPALLSLSKFAVFFIKPSYSKQSSSPTKHGEIMAMGIPVITNQGVGDVEEIVTKYDSGVVLKELNDNEFHKAAAFISSESFSDTNCIRHAAKEFYDLKSATEKYKTIYDKICTSSSNQIE